MVSDKENAPPSPVAGGGESARQVLLANLEGAAQTIIRADGDRDYENPSDLDCEQTQAIAELLREAAKAISPSPPVEMPEWAELAEEQQRVISDAIWVQRLAYEYGLHGSPALYDAIRRALTPAGVE